MSYQRVWHCKACGELQTTVDWPRYEYCERHDTFTRVPCVGCGRPTKVTPADLWVARRRFAVHDYCVLIEGGSDADVQNVRSGDGSAPDPGRPSEEDSGREERDEPDGERSLARGGLVDDSANGAGGESGLERREPRGARGDLPGTQGAVVAVGDLVRITHGDRCGFRGEVRKIEGVVSGRRKLTVIGADSIHVSRPEPVWEEHVERI